jgi:hypothetical protein
VSRSVLLLLVKSMCFQLRLETEVLSLAKPPSWLETDGFKLKEERKWTNVETRLLKVKHMSRLDITRPYFTLAYQIIFHNRHFQTCVAST